MAMKQKHTVQQTNQPTTRKIIFLKKHNKKKAFKHNQNELHVYREKERGRERERENGRNLTQDNKHYRVELMMPRKHQIT